MINKAKEDMAVFMNAPGGQFFVGESGTDLLFRLIMNACLGTGVGQVLGTTLEHPATRSACGPLGWRIAGQEHVLVAHDNATGTVTADAYAARVTPDTNVATIVHTSPVTGMGVDVAAVAAAIRAVAPECYHHRRWYPARGTHGRIDLSGIRCRWLCDFTLQGVLAPWLWRSVDF